MSQLVLRVARASYHQAWSQSLKGGTRPCLWFCDNRRKPWPWPSNDSSINHSSFKEVKDSFRSDNIEEYKKCNNLKLNLIIFNLIESKHEDLAVREAQDLNEVSRLMEELGVKNCNYFESTPPYKK
ncbi:hypothetical protein ElyMa_001932900 [Elysia marginata]|uniref:Uncharacterized protein n=1 Tax=Elysia marginata TaxID=1093978 RepID=A0AAV4EWY0_9GAST|nr:hypothetical protein ElyMa_001932900 [Elysia marginata]